MDQAETLLQSRIESGGVTVPRVFNMILAPTKQHRETGGSADREASKPQRGQLSIPAGGLKKPEGVEMKLKIDEKKLVPTPSK